MIGRQQNNQEGKTPSLFIPQGGPNQASLSFSESKDSEAKRAETYWTNYPRSVSDVGFYIKPNH